MIFFSLSMCLSLLELERDPLSNKRGNTENDFASIPLKVPIYEVYLAVFSVGHTGLNLAYSLYFLIINVKLYADKL